MRRRGTAAVLVGLTTALATAQEPIVYKDYAYKKGDVTRTTHTSEETGASTFVVNGEEQRKAHTKKETAVYTTEILSVGADPTRPEKVRRTYETAVETTDGAGAKKTPLHGLTVVIERAADKYTFFGADGAALQGPAAAELDKSFKKKRNILDDREFFPADGAKVGVRWDLSDKFLKELNTPSSSFVFDPAATKATGKLLAVTKTGGATVGDVTITADLPVKAMNGPFPVRLEPGAKWTVAVTGRGVLDGSGPENTTTVTIRIGIAGAAKNVGLKVDGTMKLSSKTERVIGAK